MKTRFLLTSPRWPLLALVVLLALGVAACNTPQPLPVAPTPIPTLPPATLPAPDMGARPPEGIALPVSAPDATAGAAIYQANCAACHGADGQGQVEKARNFGDVDYVRAAAPVAFYQAITNGQGSMPGFKQQLSDEERWNVTFYLWHFSVDAATLAQGKKVYEEQGCLACHGAEGQGAIPQARKFTPDFIASYSASQFYQSVSAGKGIMPPHQDRISVADRWASVEYVRAFAYKPASK